MSKISFMPDRLRSIRCGLNLSLTEAAQRCGLDTPVFWRYEHGTALPSYPAVYTMALNLSTSVAYLCGNSDDPAPTVIPIDVSDDPEVLVYLDKYTKLTASQREILKIIENEFLNLNKDGE